MVHTTPAVESKFDAYPKHIQPVMRELRTLIIETASEIEEVKEIVETLKWGEPSYLVKNGSTLRMDWKERSPDLYALYFNCNTRLVETFKAVFGDLFVYEKNRAIHFNLGDQIPREALKRCIKMTFCYHRLKSLPLLGE